MQPSETPDENTVIDWMDWHGPDVLRQLHEGHVDEIHWGITDSEKFEKVKKKATGKRVLCVTGKHPDDETKETSA